MKILTYQHNWHSNVSDSVRVGVNHLIGVAERMPFPIWPEKSPKANDETITCPRKLKELRGYCGLQSVMNTYFEQELMDHGFKMQVDPRPGSSQKMDFLRPNVYGEQPTGYEMEFGYTARIESNLMKFSDSYLKGRMGSAVLVVPTSSVARQLASGVATFENAVELLKFWSPELVRCPVLVVGLDDENTKVIDFSESCIPTAQHLSGNSNKRVIWHAVESFRNGLPMSEIGLPGAALQRRLKTVTKRPALNLAQEAMF